MDDLDSPVLSQPPRLTPYTLSTPQVQFWFRAGVHELHCASFCNDQREVQFNGHVSIPGRLTLNGLAASQTHLPPNELLYVMVDPLSRVMSEPCPPVVAVAEGADVVAVAVPVPLAVLLEPVLPLPLPLPVPMPMPDLLRVRLRMCQHLLQL